MPTIDPQTILNDTVGAAAIDHRTAAALCCAFYKNFDTGQLHATFPPGWNRLKQVSPQGGYDGVALHHPASRTLVIVNRGTETSRDDWWQNVGAAVAGAPGRQIWDAQQLMVDGVTLAGQQGLTVDRVLLTGHSLGGALAEAQALLSPTLLPAGLRDRIEAVGVASAGFGKAVKAFSTAYGRPLHADPASVIVHYVRKEDSVPHHPGRKVFGREVVVASVYETRLENQHSGPARWMRVVDKLANHASRSHLDFWGEPGASRHIWYSRNSKTFEARDRATPGWRSRAGRPADW